MDDLVKPFADIFHSYATGVINGSKTYIWPPNLGTPDTTTTVYTKFNNDLEIEATLSYLVHDAIKHHGFETDEQKEALLAMAQELRELAELIEDQSKWTNL